jgi:hypothetical protein
LLPWQAQLLKAEPALRISETRDDGLS